MTEEILTPREELSALLPWYAAGTLSRDEMDRIEAALDGDASLRSELDLIREDLAAARALADAHELPDSMEARFGAALSGHIAKSDREGAGAAVARLPRESWLSRVAGTLFPSPGFAFASIAAALLIAVQAGFIVSLLTGAPDTPGYRTASGETETGGLAVLVKFRPDVAMEDVSAWLEGKQAHIVEGPLPGGMYRLQFPADAAESAAALATALSGEEPVQIALPAG